ncbi:very-short-patch-repair endonuclease [Marisediminicola sp. UYEF4]|uniref:DUF559 domain-containing protein n=1 Tax=Marisediminicola sp. UYEF4 TaxID=1756384 RepID=UPI003399CEF7
MMRVAEVLQMAGGIASLDEFELNRVGARAVQRASRSGVIFRVRRGWYAAAGAPAELVRAVRVGGALGCVSGCAEYGLWLPPGAALHVSVGRGARHIKHPDTAAVVRRFSPHDGVVLHWDRADNSPAGRRLLPLIECIRQVFACQPEEIAFTMLESALRQGLLSPGELDWLDGQVTARQRDVVRLAGVLADSGTESLFRFRMMRVGVTMRSQVRIAGVGRVDFVIGDRLSIEIDSEAHHGGANRRRDLARDAALTRRDYLSLRFDYHQVLHDWAIVEATVLAVIARGDHLARVSPRSDAVSFGRPHVQR